jgi:hypothetical protein
MIFLTACKEMDDIELEVRSNGSSSSSIDLNAFPKVGPLSPPLKPVQPVKAEKTYATCAILGIACTLVNTVLLAVLLARQ